MSEAKTSSYLSDPSNQPSSQCCKAFASFNAASCSCNQPLMTLVASYGLTPKVYEQFGKSLSTACKFNLIYGPTCPMS